jgi:hypothetical protein
MSNSQAARLKRRRQLEREMQERDLHFPSKIKRIIDSPIATAEGILSLPYGRVSPIVRGTAAKQLKNAIASVSGYRNMPIYRMNKLIKLLNDRGVPYPHANLPPKSHDEEVLEVVDDILRQQFPYLRHDDCTPIARRLLALIHKTFTIMPPEARKQIEKLAKFVPEYKPEPNFTAQFEEHLSLGEQLDRMDKHFRYQQAVQLFNAKPAGHA